MKHLKLHGIWAALALAATPLLSEAQLLKGTAEEGVGELQAVLTEDGDITSAEYFPLKTDKDGKFTFDKKLEKGYEDIPIYVGDWGICGVHLVPGETLTLHIRKGEDGKNVYKFEGKNKEVSEFYTAYLQAFDLMRYLPMNPEEAKPYEENRKILATEHEKMKGMLQNIKDKKLREYYSRLVESNNKSITARLIENEAYEQKKQVMDFPEYAKLMETIDINDEVNLATGATYSKIQSQIPCQTDEIYNTDYCLKFMDIVSNTATNPTVKKALTRFCGYAYFAYGEKEDYMKFWEAYKTFAKDYPEYIALYQPQVDALNKTAKGMAAYDATLTTREGTTCRLSDLFGKFLYIDVWATWCGPCCAEIPHLEKVAAHFKGNDKVRIVSISIDADVKAWQAKLEKDQPEWEQYVLTPEEATAFQQAWGINGIPRFLMIDPQGKIFDADAPRPSNERTIEIIEEQLK